MHKLDIPTSYVDAREALGGKLARALGRDVLLIRGIDGESIALSYKHKTVAIFFSGGVLLRSKGEPTSGARAILNAVLAPHRWQLYDGHTEGEEPVWKLKSCETGKEYVFEDGMVMPLSATTNRFIMPLDIEAWEG